MIAIHLPDGSQKQLPAGATAYDLAKSISEGLAKQAMAAVINEETRDLRFTLQDGDRVKILTPKDPEAIEVLRHSTAHVLAQAVQKLFPQAKISIGPTIENGFYYDFDIAEHKLTPEDFEAIEAEMQRIVANAQRFERRTLNNTADQLEIFKTQGEKYKAELLEQIVARQDEATAYFCVDSQNNQDIWSDLCRGPHLPDTSWIKAFKLLSVAGAYWRGDEKNAQLQRVYATAFWSPKDLEAFLKQREEAEKRDHRKLAKQYHLFSIEEEIGPGLVLWHPNLAIVREELENYWRQEHHRRGYDLVYTPHLAKKDLWEISGHTSFYLENMFNLAIEDQEYILKPMNCPMHVMIYKSQLRSYRDLPLRLGELGTVYRYEKSGVMHGLNRVRGFTQDDAHLFCRPDQVTSEIQDVIRFVDDTLKLFGMVFDLELSTRPEKYVGSLEIWDQAEAALKDAMDRYGLTYQINEGDGAFYGPKIDFKLKDAIGRTWQCATVQLDFNLPERFDLKYTDADGQAKRPIMLHRVIFGSMERFAGTLIEHYAGAFPAWLSPVQVMLLPIADRHLERAHALENTLRQADIRVKIDSSSESFNAKVRNAQLAKVPYMLVLGDKEVDSGQVAVRSRGGGNLGVTSFEAFLAALKTEITSHGQTPVAFEQTVTA